MFSITTTPIGNVFFLNICKEKHNNIFIYSGKGRYPLILDYSFKIRKLEKLYRYPIKVFTDINAQEIEFSGSTEEIE